jgi:UDP-N-acetylglucosamine 2-epimerase (non-hydrolysing)
MPKVLTVFGTRPEVIKLAPVIRELEAPGRGYETVNVASGQHRELIEPLCGLFGLRVDHDLAVMRPGQSPSRLCARILEALDPVLVDEAPDIVLVQGDTTTALAGALAGFHRRIAIGHVEAGLRSGDPSTPFPEEMNRRLVSRLTTWNFAPTPLNRTTLLSEGVPAEQIFVTGNPVVDALRHILATAEPSASLREVLDATDGLELIVLTMHRRENHGRFMQTCLRRLATFVASRPRTALVFPVHPNPAVLAAAKTLRGRPRVHLIEPLDYPDFIHLLSRAQLIISDSGGVQEEAPTLGKPLIVLRAQTERPEALTCGVARLLGPDPERVRPLLEEAFEEGSWTRRVQRVPNPFGSGDAARRIVSAIGDVLVGEMPLAAVGAP